MNYTKFGWLLAALLLTLGGCSSAPPRKSAQVPTPQDGLLNDLIAAENQASGAGRKILVAGRKMTLERKEIVRGSCWDYSNAVYSRTGYPIDCRKVIFNGSKNKGPYASAQLIEPGDWLYFINHSYKDIEHSAIFVKWVNYNKRIALMLSYGGEKRVESGRYLPYDISHVYQIVRADKEDRWAAR